MGFESVLKEAQNCRTVRWVLSVPPACETQFVMFRRWVSELVIKGAVEDMKGDIWEDVKQIPRFSGMYYLIEPTKLSEFGSRLQSWVGMTERLIPGLQEEPHEEIPLRPKERGAVDVVCGQNSQVSVSAFMALIRLFRVNFGRIYVI